MSARSDSQGLSSFCSRGLLGRRSQTDFYKHLSPHKPKMDSTKFDDILMGILQHCEQVEPFLDAIFSFLARRTDFFRVMQNREDKMGFPPGVAEKIVLKVII